MAEQRVYEALHISDLIVKMLEERLTKEESLQLSEWIDAAPENRLLVDSLKGDPLRSDMAKLNSFDKDKAFDIVMQRIRTGNDPVVRPIRISRALIRYSAAAAVIASLSFGFWFFNRKTAPVPRESVVTKVEIHPGSNRAILILGNGRRVDLTGTKKGAVARQENVVINKTGDGKIIYQQNGAANQVKEDYNTIEVPRGGLFQITLSDGTHVWLNSATTLRYPSSFRGTDRRVELTGEAYFEVAHDAQHPFKVATNSQEVEVLGTHFDVSAYPDDQRTATTLLQGSVRVSAQNQKALLKPGQSAFNDGAGHITVAKANVNDVIAWKNGLFSFKDVSVKEVLKKAARWYDVEVVYQGQVPDPRIWATVSVYKNIDELLGNICLTTGLHYKIEGRRVILMK